MAKNAELEMTSDTTGLELLCALQGFTEFRAELERSDEKPENAATYGQELERLYDSAYGMRDSRLTVTRLPSGDPDAIKKVLCADNDRVLRSKERAHGFIALELMKSCGQFAIFSELPGFLSILSAEPEQRENVMRQKRFDITPFRFDSLSGEIQPNVAITVG
jgi:hypothetical protein